MFQRGDLVWGKMKTYPWWPAIILDAKDCGKKQSKNKMWLFWFGDNKISELECERIVTFEDNYLQNASKRSGNLFKTAVQEILKVKAYQQHLVLDDISSLHEWAVSGFKNSSISCSIKKYEINGLPEIVINALENLQSKHISDDDSDDDEKDPVYEVQRGLKTLHEICIACCRSGSRIVSQHPLFVGGLCVLCTKTVYKVCSLPFGQAQDFCILCGLGGTLVYCSNSLCVRAYCNVCIDYLAPEGAYSQILQNDTWVCYLCKSDPDRSCLIKRQKKYETVMYTPPRPPKEKLPICVISQNDICLNVLMKEKIIIEKYYTQPCKDAESCEHTKYSENYEDFSEKEFTDIGADLVYGSYISNGSLEDRKACVADFFVAFFRFIFRLDNAKLYKPYVFFIFIANASIMDEEILTRGTRFIMVEPLYFTVEKRDYIIWCNIPNASKCFKNQSMKKRVNKKDFVAEEVILTSLFQTLRTYFAHLK